MKLTEKAGLEIARVLNKYLEPSDRIEIALHLNSVNGESVNLQAVPLKPCGAQSSDNDRRPCHLPKGHGGRHQSYTEGTVDWKI